MADEEVPDRDDVPSTLQRSEPKAQRTYVKAKDSAYETRDDATYANRVAWSAVKHSYAKVGDHWEAKEERGPSDAQAARSGEEARDSDEPTGGGVDENASKAELYEQAREQDVPGRSKMSKDELVDALEAESRRATRRARDSDD